MSRPPLLAVTVLGFLTASSALEAGGLEITVSPRTVYRGCRYRLEAKLEGGADSRRAVVRWEAGGGRLYGGRGSRTFWEAPAAAGPVKVRARVLRGDAALESETTIDVREPSRAGMVRVPAGAFLRGDAWTDTSDPRYLHTDQNKHDRPAHPVELDEFLIDRCEVTNRQYAEFLQAALAEGVAQVMEHYVAGEHEGTEAPFFRFSFEAAPLPPREIPALEGAITWDGSKLVIRQGCEDHPVVDVTWAGSAAFAAYYGKRLPTEAEWEKAAGGTDGRRYPWGNELPSRYHANVNQYYSGLTPVGKFSPRGDSPYGVCDMVGNAHEWVQDWFQGDLFEDLASGAAVKNPPGPEWGIDHAVRGFSWVNHTLATPRERSPLSWRYSWGFESSYGEGYADSRTGFRTALSLLPSGRVPSPPGPPKGEFRGARSP